MEKAIFVAIEGPNGSGKSTVIKLTSQILRRRSIQCICTKEPSTSQLGQFIRFNQHIYSKEVLACLIAANRYEHQERVIKPNLGSGISVISDRYFPSSLVYQQIDGVEKAFIWDINRNIIKPDLTIFLLPDSAALTNRIAGRSEKTRFERNAEHELRIYTETVQDLKLAGWNAVTIDSAALSAEECAFAAFNHIVKLC